MVLAGPLLAPASFRPALAGSRFALASPGLAPAGSGPVLAGSTVAPAGPALRRAPRSRRPSRHRPRSTLPSRSEPDGRGHPILENGRIVGHSEFFWEAFIDAVNVLAALMVSPRDFAFLLDAMGGLALEHVDKIAVARLAEPED